MKKTLIMTMGGRGGVGKTIALVSIADYLKSKGHKIATVDCDTENADKVSAFAHWFDGKTERLNLRNPKDCDRLLVDASSAPCDYVLTDLPANAGGDLAEWWQDAVTSETLEELELSILAVGVITQQEGSAHSVMEWVDALGQHVGYLVALNRLVAERVPAPAMEAFADWHAIAPKDIAIPTFEIPHLYDEDMGTLTRLGMLPGKAIQGTNLFILPRTRVKRWRDKIHRSLDSSGLFTLNAAETLEPVS